MAEQGAGAEPPAWQRLIGLLALPRSGTTMTTAVFGAHSQVLEVYEPWNDTSAGLQGDQPAAYAPFVARFAPEPHGRTTLMVKETTTQPQYIHRLIELLDDAPAGVETVLILLVRNPFHVFLSGYHARRDWWGQPDLTLDSKTFTAWARNALDRYKALGALAERRPALLVSYDRLVREADAVPMLMTAVGLAAEAQQAQFGAHIDLTRVRGDPKLTSEPQAITDEAAVTREREFEALKPMFQRSPHFPAIRRIAHQTAQLGVVTRAAKAIPMIRAMLGTPPIAKPAARPIKARLDSPSRDTKHLPPAR